MKPNPRPLPPASASIWPSTSGAARAALGALLAASLCGCVGAAVKGARTAGDQLTIAANEDAADRGDPAAQFAVGQRYCCAIGAMDPLHDNAKATDYLCRAARQGYTPAQKLLARIYAGFPMTRIDPGQSLKLRLAGAPQNLPVAYAWASLAASAGDAEAQSRVQEAAWQMTLPQLQQAQLYLRNWQAMPCRYGEVFPGG